MTARSSSRHGTRQSWPAPRSRKASLGSPEKVRNRMPTKTNAQIWAAPGICTGCRLAGRASASFAGNTGSLPLR
eukprot:12888334-Prorocentrum_lima.AAC.1